MDWVADMGRQSEWRMSWPSKRGVSDCEPSGISFSFEEIRWSHRSFLPRFSSVSRVGAGYARAEGPRHAWDHAGLVCTVESSLSLPSSGNGKSIV
jgi:hypothetical protein